MDTLIEKPVFQDTADVPNSQLARRACDIRDESGRAPSRLFQGNASLPLQQDEFEVFEQTLHALCKVNRDREAIAESLNYFDDRLSGRRFRECNRALHQLHVDRLASSVLVSILGMTVPVKALAGRASFYERSFQEIARRKGKKYARELLAKYR
jgi:hypothetical protein